MKRMTFARLIVINVVIVSIALLICNISKALLA